MQAFGYFLQVVNYCADMGVLFCSPVAELYTWYEPWTSFHEKSINAMMLDASPSADAGSILRSLGKYGRGELTLIASSLKV